MADRPTQLQQVWSVYRELAEIFYRELDRLDPGEELPWDELNDGERHLYTAAISALFRDVRTLKRALDFTDNGVIGGRTNSHEKAHMSN